MQTIYYNGDIVTMKCESDTVEAVLTQDGSILAAGTMDEISGQSENGAKRIDLQGRTMLPAFLDSHSHITMLAQNLMKADLTEAESFEDIVRILCDFRKKNNLVHGEYIQGFGYDQNRLKERTHPTKDILNQVSKDNPIFIFHVSCHMGVANSLALMQAGMDGYTDLPKGLVGRLEGSQELSGYVAETGMMQIYMQLFKIPLDMKRLLKEAQDIYLKNGICTIQDGAAAKEQFDMLCQLAKGGLFQADIVAYLTAAEGLDEILLQYDDFSGKYYNNVKLGGCKLVLDGSPQGKTAWLSQPYTDGTNGNAWMQEADVTRFIKAAIDKGIQVLAHCNGDAASQQFLDSYKAAFDASEYPGKHGLRPVMIHSQTVRRDQLKEFDAFGMMPSFFVEHVYYWGDVHLQNLGRERADNISPTGWANELGLTYTFHQDTPVLPPDMMHTIQTAVERRSLAGEVLGEKHKISVYQALKAVTINAAYQYHEETTKGSIEKGKNADFVILSDNPLKTETAHISEIQIEATICRDRVLYQR